MNLRLLEKKGPRFQQLNKHDYIIFNYKRYKLQRLDGIYYSCHKLCVFGGKNDGCPGTKERAFHPCVKIRHDGIKGYFTKAIQ